MEKKGAFQNSRKVQLTTLLNSFKRTSLMMDATLNYKLDLSYPERSELKETNRVHDNWNNAGMDCTIADDGHDVRTEWLKEILWFIESSACGIDRKTGNDPCRGTYALVFQHVVLFYTTFSNSYGGYVRLGHIEDISGLASALGTGSVQVTFSVSD